MPWSEPIEGKGSAWDFETDPVLEAHYERRWELDVADRFSDVPGAMRVQTIHRFVKDGDTVDVWGSADLDGKLRAVKPGTLTRIVFQGREDIGNGKSMKRYQVQVDESAPPPAAVTVPDADDDIPF